MRHCRRLRWSVCIRLVFALYLKCCGAAGPFGSTLECNIHTINLHLSVSTQKPLMAGKKKTFVNYCQDHIPPLPLGCKAILRFLGDPE